MASEQAKSPDRICYDTLLSERIYIDAEPQLASDIKTMLQQVAPNASIHAKLINEITEASGKKLIVR